MQILSLDLSTKSSGFAIFEDKELKDYGCFQNTSTKLLTRIKFMRDEIKKILSKYQINKIILEEVRPDFGGNIQTHRALMWLQAAVMLMLDDDFPKLEIEYTYPSEWRAACGIKNGRGIKREQAKQLDIDFVKNTFNIDVNDDIADAICIGYSKIK